jgi:hypothetical protein
MQSQADQDKVRAVMQSYQEMQNVRTGFEGHWNDLAHYVWPELRNTFTNANLSGNRAETPGVKKTQKQLDATPAIALNQFAAIMDSLLTPRNQIWHQLKSDNAEINKDRDAVLWFEELNRSLFRHRYAPTANFAAQNQLQYKNLGAFGTGVMFIDGQIDGTGLRYKNISMGEVFIRENHQGVIDTALRYFLVPGYNVLTQFKEDELPDGLIKQATKMPEQLFAFANVVSPNKDLDPTRLDFRGKKWSSTTISIDFKWLIREGGFHTFPYIGSRYEQAPTEVYGRSPAMMALPAIKTLQAQKSVVLKQGHRTVDPVLLTHDDGVLDGFSLTPGATNPGGVNHEGRAMVQTLPVGNVQVGLEMMQQERDIINSSFLVHLFEILMETPRMTATEVVERVSQRGILLAPTVGRQQSEYLGPTVEREIDVLVEQGAVRPMPPILVEAQGEYTLEYNSPLSRTMRAEEAAGLNRVMEATIAVINATGDTSPMDNFDMDVVTREVAVISAVPLPWMRSEEDVKKIRAERAEAAEREAQAAEAPGQAALQNADTKARQA